MVVLCPDKKNYKARQKFRFGIFRHNTDKMTVHQAGAQQRSSHGMATQMAEVFSGQRQQMHVFRQEPLVERKKRLRKLKAWIHKHRPAIHQAMHSDFRKPSQEVDAIEIFHVLQEIKVALDELNQWAESKKVDAPLTMLGTTSYIQYEPKGVCLIISPWNYPFSLAVAPMVSAIAAGNTVILKPSEHTPHVSALMAKMAHEIFKKEEVAVFEGGADVATALLDLPFDHIFFTGSPAVGKIIMKAAAEHLTSVTLELGGKSPAIVAADADIAEAAERIAVAKFVNNGQTCIAPDYVLVDSRVAEKFSAELIQKKKTLFAGNAKSFEHSEDYCRIVNDHHHERLTELVEDAVRKGARILSDGVHNKADRFFHPVVLTNIPADARLVDEEIFGPVLPVITFDEISEAISMVNSKPKPLALYIFSRKKGIQNRVLKEISAGGVCINDCGIHFLNHKLPFGGVNHSGIGKSHGQYGFLAFSNEKPVLKQRSGITSVKAFYPPYTATSRRLMDWFLKLF
jgi:aldehyde dehydrogenase (NAD+)